MSAPHATPDRWLQVKQVLQSALDLPPGARENYLKNACGDDLELRREVDSLLAADAAAASFLAGPIGDLASAVDQLEPGELLGQYQIVQMIGEGGMGMVYQALRQDIVKLVAIKVVKRSLHSQFVLDRFATERQILGHFDHPNITKFLDSGVTPDGRPYFVMEFIAGKQIDVYCQEKKLNTRQRLELFLKVCAGVEYAHRNMVVHRDLKPRNILITEEGEPKLLDFGIAKILEEDPSTGSTDNTVTMVRMMTPEYASPEQARGEPVNTVSDVYTLGVVLYELLTGHAPYRLKGRTPYEAAEAICSQEPTRPSVAVRDRRDDDTVKLRRALAGDLDNIVLKAMEKKPERRYSSVEKLAEDIWRHLDGLPVEARGAAWSYRAGKFLRRNQSSAIAAMLVFVSIVSGAGLSLRAAHIANLERERAERRFHEVRTLANSLLFELHDAIQHLPGATPARELLVKRAMQYLDSLAKESADDPGLRSELAAAYEKLGDVQGGYRSANLGDVPGAIASYRKALALRESLAAGDSNITLQRDLFRSHGKLSDVLLQTGNSAEAMEHSRKVLALAAKLAERDPESVENQSNLAVAYLDFGWKQTGGGDWKSGLENLQHSVALLERLAVTNSENGSLLRRLVIAYERTGDVIRNNTDRFEEAVALQRKELTLVEKVAAAAPLNADLQRLAAYGHMDLGQDFLAMQNYVQAKPQFAQAVTEFEKLSAADEKNAQFHLDVASALGYQAEAEIAMGAPADALPKLKRALEIRGNRHDATVAMDQFRLGKALAKLGRRQEAREWYEKAIPGLEAAKLTGRDAAILLEARAGAAGK